MIKVKEQHMRNRYGIEYHINLNHIQYMKTKYNIMLDRKHLNSINGIKQYNKDTSQ